MLNQMEKLMFRFLLLFSGIGTLIGGHNHDHHHRPDTIPEANLEPLERFKTTTPASHAHHHLDHTWNQDYNYNYDYSEYPSADHIHETNSFETTTTEDFTTIQVPPESCTKYEWMCKSGSITCIPEYKLCDGEFDCSDRSDEVDCDNEKDLFIAKSCSRILSPLSCLLLLVVAVYLFFIK